MVRLRILIIAFSSWLTLLFNIERPDILGINLSSSVYILASGLVIATLLLPDLNSIRLDVLLVVSGILYLFTRSFAEDDASSLPVAIIVELVILSATIGLGRLISSVVTNFEHVFESVVTGAGETRAHSTIVGDEEMNAELFRARRFNRPVGFIYFRVEALTQTRTSTDVLFNYEAILQRRYLRNRVSRIAEAALYMDELVVWYGDNVLVCLPESSPENTAAVEQRINDLIRLALNVRIPSGTANFPDDGFVLKDLVKKAIQKADEVADNNTANPIRRPTSVDSGNGSSQAQVSNRQVNMFQSLKTVFGSGFPVPHRLAPEFDGAGVSVLSATPYFHPNFWANQLPYQTASARNIYLRIKRLMDIVIVLLALPALVPLTALVAGLILLDDGAPIFYVQKRTGVGGHQFKMYKFRSMILNADQKLAELNVSVNERGETINERGEKLENDPRITRVGKLLRKTSLDELPQIWNVLVGQMSLVGPRPTSFGVEKYALFHTERLNVKPGITGLWQIYDRGDTDFDNRLIWDIKYIEKLSLALDLQILVRTALRVLQHDGAR
mgnify:CR=1 FL=1